MPIYEYQCLRCNNKFEALLWASDDQHAVKCPKCDAGEVERVLSIFSRASASDGGSKSACGPSSGGFS